MSRAFGSRPTRQADDPVPDLDEVLTDLHVSEQENDQHYEIDRIDFAETAAPAATTAATSSNTRSAGSSRSGGTARSEIEAHRKRLEQLLENARHIEEMLAKEAAQARSLGENLKLEEKRAAVSEAAEAERKAIAQAQAYTKNSETAAVHQAKVDAELASSRQELTAAETSVKELQARLADAQNLVVLSRAKVVEAESKSKEAAKRADMAKSLTAEAEIRVARSREAREVAEAEVRQGEEIASSIAMTTETLKRIRDLGSSGLP